MRGRTVLWVSMVLAPICAAPASWAGTVGYWDEVVASIFPVRADMQGYPVNCTGWFVEPSDDQPAATSVYVTAGHCGTPHVVEAFGSAALERTLSRGRVANGTDAAVGVRHDDRRQRVFLRLSTAAPEPGEPALTAGWPGTHLMAARLVFRRTRADGLVEYRSDLALQGGISGAPIVSLRTGRVIAIVAGFRLLDRHVPDYRTIVATPAAAARGLLNVAVPIETKMPAPALRAPAAFPVP